MKKTEQLLREAREIAWRAFPDPTQETVMHLFARLCDEQDLSGPEPASAEPVTVH